MLIFRFRTLVTSQQDYLAEQDCNVGAQWAYIDWSRDGLSFGGRVNATMLTTEAGEKGDAGSPQRFERGTSASDDSKVRRDISVLNPGLISTCKTITLLAHGCNLLVEIG